MPWYYRARWEGEKANMAKPRALHGKIAAAWSRVGRPNREHMAASALRVPYWWVAGLMIAFAAWQIMMDPFGFSTLTQRYTQDISNLLITGPYLYPETGRDKISVALIEEDTLHTLQMGWPWNYGAHARALDSLLALHPRAVVVDLLFVDQRKDDTLADLAGEVRRYREAGVPLYFAAAPDVPAGAPPLRRELIAAGARMVDPTTLVNQGMTRQYPVEGLCFGSKPVDGICQSLALTVYRDLYPAQPLAPLKSKMEIVWGMRTNLDPAFTGWITGGSCSIDMPFLHRMWLAFFDPEAVRARCPYTSYFPVEKLMMGDDDKDVAAMAKGRIVFYGASLEGAQDKSFTPVNGLIASVFVHAMALDNLITFHGKPEQDVATIGPVTLGSNPAQVLAIIPVILILSWLHMGDVRRRAKKPKGAEHEGAGAYIADKLASFAWHMLAFALAMGVGLVLTLTLGLSVANWVEVVFVALVVGGMLLFSIPDAIWGYLHHVATGAPREESS
jgi:hypothetical protein